MLGFVAAAIFAGIGFAVNAAVSARERLVEFALMRAVGLSNRQLIAWLGLENALLVIFGLVGGTVLGITLAWLVLPLIAITQDATVAVPGVIVIYPWQTILWLELVARARPGRRRRVADHHAHGVWGSAHCYGLGEE